MQGRSKLESIAERIADAKHSSASAVVHMTIEAIRQVTAKSGFSTPSNGTATDPLIH